MTTEHLRGRDAFTDLQASELLALLLAYHRAYEHEQDSREMSVADVAGDLIDSLPQRLEPRGCRDLLEG